MGAGAMIAGGGVSGGIGSVLGGGSFWDGLGQGLITSGFNHAAHLMQGNPLKKHIDEAMSLDEWAKRYADRSRDAIVGEVDAGGNMDSQQGGPIGRYVIDPKTGNVIDMRHFLIIGQKGRMVGNSVEVYQKLRGWPSGGDPQDYFYLSESSAEYDQAVGVGPEWICDLLQET